MNTIETRIASITERASAVATLCETDLSRRVVYSSRARIMLDAISGVATVMNEIEAVAAPSDFGEAWRSLRHRLGAAESSFQNVINGAGDIQQIPCHSRQRDSRNWT